MIFGSIGVVSAYTILANDIGYTPKDTTWEVDNVKDAIDDLYSNSIKKIIFNTFGTVKYSDTLTNISTTSRTHSITLQKGKYLVLRIDSGGWTQGNVKINEPNTRILNSNDNNTIIQEIYGRTYQNSGTGDFLAHLIINFYYVEISDNEDTLFYDYVSGSNGSLPVTQALNAIPLN